MSHLKKGLPFKGKGGLAWTRGSVRRRIAEIESGQQLIVKAMEQLAREFQAEFRPPWPVHPVVQRVGGGRVYVRWRLPGVNGQQPYVELTSETGEAVLADLSQRVQMAYHRYWREGIELNLNHALLLAEEMRLRQFLAELTAWPSASGSDNL